MSSEWTEELKTEVIDAYKAENPTPETSTEIVKEIADDLEKTVNGVRSILVRAGVYIKKDASKAATSGTKTTSTRVNKAEAIAKLDTLIADSSIELDTTITAKLTGKAALYFASIFEALTTKEA